MESIFSHIPLNDMDEIDRKIIAILHENGRASYTDISKEVGLSRVGTQLRVNALIDNGLIEKITALFDYKKLGLTVSAFFNVEVEPKYLTGVAEKLSDEPNVTSLYHMTGPSKLHMHGLFKDNEDMELFLQEKVYVLPGITSVDSQVLIKRYKSRIEF